MAWLVIGLSIVCWATAVVIGTPAMLLMAAADWLWEYAEEWQ